MKNFYLQIKLILLLLLSCELSAQQFISEQIQPPSKISDVQYVLNFDKQNYTTIKDENGIKCYTRKSDVSQFRTLANENDVTLNLNIQFDPSDENVSWIWIYSEISGYYTYTTWPGSNPVSIVVPEGNYDIATIFDKHIVIKEQIEVSEGTTIDINVEEADNHIVAGLLDDEGEPLEPGVWDPDAGIVVGGTAEMRYDCTILFQPTGLVLSNNFYTWLSKETEEDPNPWNFYINDVSSRYFIRQNCFGIGYNGIHYVSKYPTIQGVSESMELTNEVDDWVFHQEKFQPSLLGEDMDVLYGGYQITETLGDYSYGGWTIYITGYEYNIDDGLRFFLDNPINNDIAKTIVQPLLVDHIAIMMPVFGEEPFTIKGNPLFINEEGSVTYGSDDPTGSMYFLGGTFYYDEDGNSKILPFNPQFTFSAEQAPEIIQGSTTPILTSAFHPSRVRLKYKGRNGESRESDFFNTEVEIKQDDNIVFSGTYIDSRAFTIPGTGNIEMKFLNSNLNVEGISAGNTTTMTYSAEASDIEPPTLQMLQFRDISGEVTDRFTFATEGTVRLAAGDFKFIPESSLFAYNEGNTVGLYYSLYDQNEWTELPLTEYPEHFFMPAFGDYYEASLEGIENTNIDVWYDVKIICTDAAGNKQEQLVSPAFKIKNTVGVDETVNSSGRFYPNPVTDILTIENPGNEPCSVNILNSLGKLVYSGPVTNESTQSINMKSLNIRSGMYFIQLVGDHKTIASKKIIFKN